MMSPSPDKSSGNAGTGLEEAKTSVFGGPMGFYANRDDKTLNNDSQRSANEISRKRKDDSVSELDHHNCDSMSDDEDEDGRDEPELDGEKPQGKKKKVVGEKKREIKNAREKERSSRIAKQIDELRDMLTSCGVIVPKGTKSSVLSEVATYIRVLQQQQFRSEVDRNMLIQQIQLIGGGAHGPEAAAAIRHAASQNGVWSLGCFEGVQPNKQAVTTAEVSADSSSGTPPATELDGVTLNKVDAADYKCIFNTSSVGMAIASMGGAFMDCNNLFSRLSNYSKQELCALTIFNLTARNDLQRSFDLISRMITPPSDGSEEPPKHIVLRGSMHHRNDLGMSISLVKGDNGIAKCFCVTLVKNPSNPFDTAKPTPVSYESILPVANDVTPDKETSVIAINQNPTFTFG